MSTERRTFKDSNSATIATPDAQAVNNLPLNERMKRLQAVQNSGAMADPLDAAIVAKELENAPTMIAKLQADIKTNRVFGKSLERNLKVSRRALANGLKSKRAKLQRLQALERIAAQLEPSRPDTTAKPSTSSKTVPA